MKARLIQILKISSILSIIFSLLLTLFFVITDFNGLIKDGPATAVFNLVSTIVILFIALVFPIFLINILILIFKTTPIHTQNPVNTSLANNEEIKEKIEQYKEEIKSTLRDVIQISIEKAKNPLPLRQSKFGGNPFMPKEFDYPKSSTGEPLYLIAQINFAEIPNKIPDYPEKGILQFYVANDDVWGLEFEGEDQNQMSRNYRVLYFDDEKYKDEDLITDFSFLKPESERQLPIYKEFSLNFFTSKEAMGYQDYRFDKKFPDFPLEETDYEPDTISNYLGFKIAGTGHKIGGYPYFVQWDPRENLKTDKKYELLFQMDSEYKGARWEILWGDVGVANFFIDREDLTKKDFTRVLYNWDCS